MNEVGLIRLGFALRKAFHDNKAVLYSDRGLTRRYVDPTIITTTGLGALVTVWKSTGEREVTPILAPSFCCQVICSTEPISRLARAAIAKAEGKE